MPAHLEGIGEVWRALHRPLGAEPEGDAVFLGDLGEPAVDR